MKTIGIVGGVTWQSTALYYKFINEGINQKLGGNAAGKILINSVNFAEFREIQEESGWDRLGSFLAEQAKCLNDAGADFILLAANTVHKVADTVADAIDIPIIHIVDAVAEILNQMDVKKCGLLGTKYTMEDGFFTDKLLDEYNIESIIPEPDDRIFVHRIIYDELSKAVILEQTQNRLVAMIQKFKEAGADSVILGCTELGMIINDGNSPLPAVDTAKVHAEKAVQLALEE